MSISINTLYGATPQAVNYATFHKAVNAAGTQHPQRIIKQNHDTLIINDQRQLIALVVLPHLDHTGFCVPLQYHVIPPVSQPRISRYQIACLQFNEKVAYCKLQLKNSFKNLSRAGRHLAAGASPKQALPHWTTLRLTS
jgi:hypothetical protein